MAILNTKLLKNVGLTLKDMERTKTIKEYIKKNPNMVFIKSVSGKNNTLERNGNKMELLKDEVYAVSIDLYLSMRKDSKGKILFKPYRSDFKDSFRRYTGQDLTNKKLLIWRAGGYGDIMFIQPIIKFIKEKYPSCEITFATDPTYKTIFTSWPDKMVSYVTSIPIAKKVIDYNDYHLCFTDVLNNCDESKKACVYDVFKNISCLDFDIEKYNIELEPNGDLLSFVKKLIPEKTIIIQPSASTPLRSISLDKWTEIIKLINDKGYNVGILDSEKNTNKWNWYINKNKFGKNVLNLSKYSKDINIAICFLSLSTGVIATDSSISHFSAALKVPCVTIYGPYKPDMLSKYYDKTKFKGMEINSEWNECGKRHCMFQVKEARECPYIQNKQHPKCQEDIPNQEIVGELFSMLNSESGEKVNGD